MRLCNEVTTRLRKHKLGLPFVVDFAMGVSKFTKETDTMKWEIKNPEMCDKEELIRFCFNKEMSYKIPYAVKNVVSFRNVKSNKAKDFAVEIVGRICKVCCRDLEDFKESVKEGVTSMKATE